MHSSPFGIGCTEARDPGRGGEADPPHDRHERREYRNEERARNSEATIEYS
jgi:hypothetical protein